MNQNNSLLPLIAFCMIGFSSAIRAQDQPQQFPLALQDIGGSERLVIYVGIDGSAPLPYLFDTGSSGFNAAYYSGPMIGDATNNSDWSNTGTNVDNAIVSYGLASSGFSYLLNEVTVTNITIYDPVTMLGADTLTSSSGFDIGQVTQRINGTTNPSDASFTNVPYGTTNTNYYNFDTNFTGQLAKGLAPEPSVTNPALFGTFGASMFVGINTSSMTAASYTNASVLGQSTTSGWAVVANNRYNTTGSTNPYVILGLNSSITNQFSTAVSWNTNSDIKFPNSGANSGTEFDVNFDFKLTKGDLSESTNWKSATLLDSGTPDNIVSIKNDPNIPDLTDYYRDDVSSNNTTNHPFIAGTLFSAEASTNDISTNAPDNYSFTITNGDNVDPITYKAKFNPTDTSNTVTLGIGFFLSNSVAFDLATGQTLYTPNAVTVVPEPSTYALLALGALFLIIVLRRRSCPLNS